MGGYSCFFSVFLDYTSRFQGYYAKKVAKKPKSARKKGKKHFFLYL